MAAKHQTVHCNKRDQKIERQTVPPIRLE